MAKRTLVCIANYRNTEMLLNKGVEFSLGLDKTCYALTLIRDHETNYYENTRTLDEIESIASDYKIPLLKRTISNEKVATTIAEVVVEKKIDHVLIGQPRRSKWDMLVKGSLVNDLLNILIDVDLTIVEVSKDKISHDSEFDIGVSAYIVKEDDNYTLSLDEPSTYFIEGVFYQRTKTDFQSGVFKAKKDEEIFIVNVSDGEVKWTSLD
ncbi:hypothetical protein FLK61_24060 [Paenalkalicoccus suaedae]|uniref:Histidine kinase n=1 Tax=Paenalkalicoccus suaedae TaxID=2592382 RepID=A0A859FC62_9BACI|nr:hypothetical protein [Paenalkalicoccus suaedae]QKS69865.1 hypothetical protein FLK61_24060 [Paenalkalicoccus suaedae]